MDNQLPRPGSATHTRDQLRATIHSHGVKMLLSALGDDESFPTPQKLRAFDLAAKYGLGQIRTYASDEIIQIFRDLAPKYVPTPEYGQFAKELMSRLREIS